MRTPLGFGLRVALFVLPVAGVAVAAELALRAVPHDFDLRRDYVLAHGPEIETLVLGNSHAFNGVTPAGLGPGAYNLAYVSQSYAEDLAILRTYGDVLANVRRLVVAISYSSPYHRLASSPEAWRLSDYYVRLGTAAPWRDLRRRSGLLASTVAVNEERLLDYYLRGKTRLSVDSADGSIMPQPGARAEAIERNAQLAVARHSYDRAARDAREDLSDNRRDLEEILAWANRRDVAVALVTFPTHPAYHTRLDAAQLDTMRAFAARALATCDRCFYLDLLRAPGYALADFDADHVSARGARRVTAAIDSAFVAHQGE